MNWVEIGRFCHPCILVRSSINLIGEPEGTAKPAVIPEQPVRHSDKAGSFAFSQTELE